MGGMVTTADDDIAGRMRAFQQRCEPPPASLAASWAVKLVVYHLLTEPHAHRYARAAYDLLGRRTFLPVPVSDVEMEGERPEGYERRLSNVQAALGLSQLASLDANLAHRRSISAFYRALLEDARFRVPAPPAKSDPAYVRFPVWVRDREAAIRSAGRHTVVGTWFTSVLEESAAPTRHGYVTGSCPRAEQAATHLVNLPTHRRVTERDAEALVAALAEAA